MTNVPEPPYVFDEAIPSTWSIPEGTKRLLFDNSGRVPLDAKAIERVILAESTRRGVQTVEVQFRSQMETAWAIAFFPNVTTVRLRGNCLRSLDGLKRLAKLEHLTISIEKSKRRSLAILPQLKLKTLGVRVAKEEDLQFITRCPPLEFFGVGSWKWPDLSALAPIRTKGFRLNLGSAESLAGLDCGVLDRFMAMGCTKLRSAAGAKACYMTVSACNRLDVDTLGDVKGLEILEFFQQREIPSLDFVSRCRTLRILDTGGSRLPAAGWEHIAAHPALLTAEFGGRHASDAVIARLAAENPRLATTNWNIYFFRGEKVSRDDYFLLKRDRVEPGRSQMEDLS